MIQKKFRLSEREVTRVLKKAKPFFSYGIVLNRLQNNIERPRCAIIISGKSVRTSVDRNFFRRKFYTMLSGTLEKLGGYDYVFVVKKNKKLAKKDFQSILEFENDIRFLLKKV